MYMTSSDLQRLNIAEQPLVDTIATVEHHTVASDKPVNDSKDVRTFWRKYPDQKGAEDARKLISALSADDPTYGSKKRGKIKLTFTHETVRSKINRNRSRDQKEVMDGKSAAEVSCTLYRSEGLL
jgi:hypothetical protein